MDSWTAESGIEMKEKAMICKEGRCDIFWQSCNVYSCRINKRDFWRHLILEEDIGIWGIQARRNILLVWFSKPNNPNGEGISYCKDNTGCPLSSHRDLAPGSVEEPGSCFVLCWRHAEQESACRALELHNPCLTPCNICWLPFRYDDWRSDVHLTLRSKSGRKEDEKLNHCSTGLCLHLKNLCARQKMLLISHCPPWRTFSKFGAATEGGFSLHHPVSSI